MASSTELKKIFTLANGKKNIEQAVKIMTALDHDIHTETILDNLNAKKPDIRSLLLYLAKRYKPKSYLEIGVRRGFSMAMVAMGAPTCHITGVDMWVANYGAVSNPGAKFVETQLRSLGIENKLYFLNGDSGPILSELFDSNPKLKFDLILVDASHTYEGVLKDLRNCLPRMAGFMVVDDLVPDSGVEQAWLEVKQTSEREFYSQDNIGLVR